MTLWLVELLEMALVRVLGRVVLVRRRRIADEGRARRRTSRGQGTERRFRGRL